MKFDGKSFGEEVVAQTKAFFERQIAPLADRLAALEKRIDDLPLGLASQKDIATLGSCCNQLQEMVLALPGSDAVKAMVDEAIAAIPMAKDGEPGKDGRDGVDGNDGASGEKGDPGERGASVEEVASFCDEWIANRIKELPAPKDGNDGAPGLNGKDGADGMHGKDGASIGGGVIDRDGVLQVTLTDGKVIPLGVVVGKDGTDGKDGEPGQAVETGYLRHLVQEEVQKQVTAPLATAYKGVWKPGAYKHGDLVTCGGSAWIAKADTEAKPETDASWALVIKRGRDGKDGEAPRPPATVKLK